MKKILALLLALVMVLGLAACGPKDNTGDTKPNDANSANNKSEDDIIPADELTHDEAIKLQVIMPDANRKDRDMVAEKAVQLVKDELNINLDIIWIPAGDSPNTVMSTGKGWDVGYCDAAIFQNMAARNAFMDLGPYIEKGYLSYPMENLTDAQKSAHLINGKQVAVAPIKDLAQGWNYIYNADVIEDQLGVTIPEWQSGFDLVDHWYDIKEAAKGTEWEKCVIGGPGALYLPFWFQFDEFVGSMNDILVCSNMDLEKFSSFDDIDPMKVFCPYFTEDFADWVRLRKQLVTDGIEWGYQKDGGDARSHLNGGYLYTTTAGNLVFSNTSLDYELKMSNAKLAMASTGYIQAMSLVVNNNTKYPERALELLNFMYENDEWNTLWRAGIKDYHWFDADNNGVLEWNEAVSKTGGFSRNWYGNGMSHSLLQGTLDAVVANREDFVNLLSDLNTNSFVSPHLGFTFDQSKVVNEIAACAGVVTEYMTQICNSPAAITDVDATIKAFQDKLIANGVEKIVAEVQAQLDAFHAAK